MPFCKDCKHSTIGGYTGSYLCWHPNLGREMDTGLPKFRYASNMRLDEKTCGAEGKWFEEEPRTVREKYCEGWCLVFLIALLCLLIGLGLLLS